MQTTRRFSLRLAALLLAALLWLAPGAQATQAQRDAYQQAYDLLMDTSNNDLLALTLAAGTVRTLAEEGYVPALSMMAWM